MIKISIRKGLKNNVAPTKNKEIICKELAEKLMTDIEPIVTTGQILDTYKFEARVYTEYQISKVQSLIDKIKTLTKMTNTPSIALKIQEIEDILSS